MNLDSQNYEWSEVTIAVGGKIMIGVQGVRYSDRQELEPYYGKGNKPLGHARKNITFEGELRLMQFEYERLVDAAPMRDIKLLGPVSIVVCYLNPLARVVTDTLVTVKFTERSKEMNQGDGSMTVALPFVFNDLISTAT